MTRCICTLPYGVQQDIAAELVRAGILDDDLERAANSRACDLEGAIVISRWTRKYRHPAER